MVHWFYIPAAACGSTKEANRLHLTTISHPHGTLVQGVQDFSLPQILDCGQCFTFSQLPDGRWQGWAGGHALTVSQPQPDTLLFYRTDAETFRRFWQPYFDLDTDYAAIKAVLAQDETLRRAIQFAPGIRILRQDSWETLCSFIISQNNNIKRIKGIIERLCRLLGQPIGDSGFFSFPTPEELAAVTAEQLAPLRCGFRARYLIDAAQKVCSGQVRLDAIPSMPLEEARRELMQICGVGPKVADCVLLFGFHRLECCPMDVWMKRVFAVLYPNGLPDCARDFVGIAQQYLFHYARTCPQAFDPEEVSA